MNPQRIVAAVAALAIGFGITLVGVSVADDDITTEQSVLEEEFDGAGTEDVDENDDGGDDRAEQQEEVAEEADPAEIEPATSVSADQAEAEQSPTSSTCDDLASEGASNEELIEAGCEPEVSNDEPGSPRATCRVIYEVTTQGGDQGFVVVNAVQDGGVIIEPDGDFLREGAGNVERLDEVGLFFVGPDVRPIFDQPCERVGEVVAVDELPSQEEPTGSISDEVDPGNGGASPTTASDQVFPCDLPVDRVLEDLRVDGFLDLDGDFAESDWESYITLLDVALGQSTGESSFDWGVQIASTTDSAAFQDVDCGVARPIWDEVIEAPVSGGRGDPAAAVCFLVQFVELEEGAVGSVVNPFIDYLDGFGPAVAGCPILESMVL